MRRRFLLGCICAAVLPVGCGGNKLVPDDYAGPTALVRDSSVNPPDGAQVKGGHSQYFVVAAVDGKEVPNSFSQTFEGAEGYNNFRVHERKVPVRPMKITLRAVAYFPNGLKGKGGDFGMDRITASATQRTVSFSPVAGESYVVRGKADEQASSVWIETGSGQRVTDVTVTKQPGAAAQ